MLRKFLAGAAIAALPVLALAGTASASASAAAPAVHSAAAAPPPCAVGTDTFTDNGVAGLEIKGGGAGADVTMVANGGNCFTAHFATGDAYIYENGSGNCLYASHGGAGPIVLSATCSTSDQFEQWVGTSAVDTSGNDGYLLQCTDAGCNPAGDDVMCAESGSAGADVTMQAQTGTPDRCVWTGPGVI
jgi:hypothetical protein